MTCTTTSTGNQCLSSNATDPLSCKLWDISKQTKISCLADNYIQEQLNIAGAPLNIRKLLGVYEQTLLVDFCNNGNSISGGDFVNFPSKNAFNKTNYFWKSIQSGQSLLDRGYIGYDFGEIKLPNGRVRYGIETSIRHMISTIKIKQGDDPSNRVTKCRVERSEDGISWYGVAMINLPNDNNLNEINFKQSVTNRYWRLRPIVFNGSNCDNWVVKALELSDFSKTEIQNIEDPILMENRDRNYSPTAISIKGFYDLVNTSSDLSKFGIEIKQSYTIKINFNTCIATIGRPIVIGDIIEIPSEAQYTADLRLVKRYIEVTDVTWDTASYTPGWQPTMLLITGSPAMQSQETQDIFGSLAKHVDSSGLFNLDDGNSNNWQDFSNITHQINQQSLNELPERGSDAINSFRTLTPEEIKLATDANFPHIKNVNIPGGKLYIESALPPNGLPYTEGTSYPTNQKDGDYHRMIYVGLSGDVPARLYRWSTIKNRWVYLETDNRAAFNNQKELLNEYQLNNQLKVPARTVNYSL